MTVSSEMGVTELGRGEADLVCMNVVVGSIGAKGRKFLGNAAQPKLSFNLSIVVALRY